MINPVSARIVREALTSKGFVLSEKGNRDHEMYLFHLDGKKTNVWCKLSRGASHLRRDDINNNARAIKLRGDHLHSIVCCNFDATQTRTTIEAALATR